jgi:hypothetical protein
MNKIAALKSGQPKKTFPTSPNFNGGQRKSNFFIRRARPEDFFYFPRGHPRG